MEIISGLKRTCLETTAMWENSTVLPDYWLVSACVFPARPSSVQPPALTLRFVLFGVECDLYMAPGFLYCVTLNVYTVACFHVHLLNVCCFLQVLALTSTTKQPTYGEHA